jgi:Ca2+-binding EF-hand superfamily protein
MTRLPTKEEIETIFKAVDTDADGFISVDELFNALGKTNFRRDEIESVVGLLDKDGLNIFMKS